jgi:NAD(P)-dependent dehydrogenase (short-subunit alcohol dehydrogenase family)
MPAQKVILITGASSGIGRATARFLAKQGYRVFGTSRKPVQPELDGFRLLALDVRQPESIRACVQAVIEQAGRIDVLINNAGIDGPLASSEEASPEQMRGVFETNFFGVVQVTNAVLLAMRRQRSGQIINISSLAGYMAAPPFFGFYAASKHALEGYSETLRYEVAPFNITISLVEPSYFKTSIDQTVELPANPIPDYTARRERIHAMDTLGIQRGRDPIEVARLIHQIIESEAPRLRYPAGLESQFMATAKRILPFAIIERFLTWLFMEGSASPDMTKLGIRRYFIDGQALDELRPPLLGAIGLAAIVLSRRRRKKGRAR